MYLPLLISSITVHAITLIVHVITFYAFLKTRSRSRNARPFQLHLSAIVLIQTVTTIVFQTYVYTNNTNRKNNQGVRLNICTPTCSQRILVIPLIIQVAYLLLILSFTISQLIAVFNPFGYPFICSRARFRKAARWNWVICVVIFSLLMVFYSRYTMNTIAIVFLALLSVVYLLIFFLAVKICQIFYESKRVLGGALKRKSTSRVKPVGESVTDPPITNTQHNTSPIPMANKKTPLQNKISYTETSSSHLHQTAQRSLCQNPSVSPTTITPIKRRRHNSIKDRIKPTQKQRKLLNLSACILLTFTLFYVAPLLTYMVVYNTVKFLPYFFSTCYAPVVSTGYMINSVVHIFVTSEIRKTMRQLFQSFSPCC